MSRFTKNLLPLLALITVTAAAAMAQTSGAHFQRNSVRASINDDGDLRVSWVEAGLGNATVDYTLRADFVGQHFCRTNSGGIPNADNKESQQGSATAAGSFETKNGKVSAALSLLLAAPVDEPPTCGRGQSLDLQSVTYSNIVLTDATNGVSIAITAVSRTFFPAP